MPDNDELAPIACGLLHGLDRVDDGPGVVLQGRAVVVGGQVGGHDLVAPPAELPFEFLLNALRLKEGFSLAEFELATGLPAATLQAGLAAEASRGLVEERSGRVRATPLGFRFLNDLLAAFLPPEKPGGGRSELYTASAPGVSDRRFRDFVTDLP